jgi:hypothetical protein
MNVEIVTEATQFPEKEYIMGLSLQCGAHFFIGNVLLVTFCIASNIDIMEGGAHFYTLVFHATPPYGR